MLVHFIQLLLHAHNSLKFCFEVKLNSMPLEFPNNFEDILKNMILFQTLLNSITLHQYWMSYIYNSLFNKVTKKDVFEFFFLNHPTYTCFILALDVQHLCLNNTNLWEKEICTMTSAKL